MKASDAKRITEDTLNNISTGSIIQEIYQLIERAAQSAEYSVIVDIRAKLKGRSIAASNNAIEAILKALRDNGFTVKYYSDQRDCAGYYTISWNQDEKSTVLHR